VVTPAPFTGLAIGRGHTCGLDLEQRAHCWGFGLAGEGGGGDLMNRYYPHPVVSDQTFTALALGSSFTAALDPDGRLWLWGMLEVTPGNFLLLPAPQRVGHADPYAAIAAGDTHLCVLDATGLASCWGDDSQGQLGIAGLPSAEAPQPVQGDHRFAGLALGGAHSCATDLGGEIWCWGNNDVGQLGSGTHDRSPAPVRVVSPRPLEGLSVGWSHGCGLDGTGTGWCWGSNHRGQLGSGWVGFYSPEPLPVASPGPLLQIVASYSFTCALDLEGKAWCWGGSDHGEEVLGTGELVDRYAPVAVSTDVRFLELVSKGWHTCGLDLQGDWHCWGENPSGQLGVDDQVHLPRPVAGPVLP
jgi:alpha-tubulin suppressor-like RCC1 family protein